MRRLFSRYAFCAGILAAAASIAGGCADNESALFVQGVLALKSPACTLKADPTSPQLPYGVLDLALNQRYTAGLLVGNQLVSRGSRDQVRTETSRIVLKGAEVTVLNDQQQEIATFSVPGTGFVDPGPGEQPGYGVLAATLIPPGIGIPPNVRVVVEVRVFGETLGGDEITSAALQFPIDVCEGCLISFPVDAIDPVTGECVVGAQASSIETPCIVGQDAAVDCRACATTLAICKKP